MDPPPPSDAVTRAVTANGLEFSYLEEGPADGRLALCMHGFPDTAHTWRHLLPRLAGAGFHACTGEGRPGGTPVPTARTPEGVVYYRSLTCRSASARG